MSLEIKTAPAIRARRPRKPRVIVRADTRKTSSAWSFLMLAMLIVAGLVGAWVAFAQPSPDPHFVAAQRMLGKYENGRTAEERNYHHPVYGMALEELDLVDPASISAEEAAELAKTIRIKIEQFQVKLEKVEDRYAANRARKREMDQQVFQAQERARLNPVTSYPECEEGNLGGHSHSHKH